MQMEETYFTPEEVAEKLKTSKATIYRWIKSRDLAAVKLGGEYRITDTDLREFIAARRTTRGEE